MHGSREEVGGGGGGGGRWSRLTLKITSSLGNKQMSCHTALHFGVKAKENQDKVPMLYLNSIKNPIKQNLLLILVLVRQ